MTPGNHEALAMVIMAAAERPALVVSEAVAAYHTPGYGGYVPGVRTQDAVGRTVRQLLTASPAGVRQNVNMGGVRIPGYSGHVPGSSENHHGMSFCRSLAEKKMMPDTPFSARGISGGSRPGMEIPGYTGWITGKVDSAAMGSSWRTLHDKLAAHNGREPSRAVARSPSEAFATPRTPRWSPDVELSGRGLMSARSTTPAALPSDSIIVGYAGHLAGMRAESVPGQTKSRAYKIQAENLGLVEGFVPRESARSNRSMELRQIKAEVPGYAGHVPGNRAELTTVGHTFKRAADPNSRTSFDPSVDPSGLVRHHRAIVGYKGHVPRLRAQSLGVGTSFHSYRSMAQPQFNKGTNGGRQHLGASPNGDGSARIAWKDPVETQSAGGKPVRIMPGNVLQRQGSAGSSRASSPGASSSYASSVGSRRGNGLTPR